MKVGQGAEEVILVVCKDGVFTGDVSDDEEEFSTELVTKAGPGVAKGGEVTFLTEERDLLACVLL